MENCHKYRKSRLPRDKTPRFLYSSPIGERPFNNVIMDFYILLKDKYGYDNIFVIMDQLRKRYFLLPYRRNINVM